MPSRLYTAACARKDRLAPRAGVAGDQSFDVYSGARLKQFQPLLPAGVKGGKDPRLAVGRNFCDLLEFRIPQQTHRQVAAFVDSPILSGNRGLPDPLLQTLQVLVVEFG
jgi:hypothetical protein